MATLTSTTTTLTATPASITVKADEPTTNRLFAEGAPTVYGDFRDDLLRDGFALVKGAVPRERAEKYGEQMFQWLEEL